MLFIKSQIIFLLSVNFILQNKGVQDQSWPKLDVDSVMLLIVKVT